MSFETIYVATATTFVVVWMVIGDILIHEKRP